VSPIRTSSEEASSGLDRTDLATPTSAEVLAFDEVGLGIESCRFFFFIFIFEDVLHVFPQLVFGLNQFDLNSVDCEQNSNSTMLDETNLPLVHEDLPFVHEDLPFVHEDLPFVHEDLPFVHEDLPFYDPGIAGIL
jgi:hypothetical protein